MLIKIKNLRLQTVVGVYDWEEKINREIIINAEIETDFKNSLISDDLADAIDYETITSKIKNLIATSRFKLVERMAQKVADVIMEDSRVKKCRVEIDKIGAVEAVESFAVVVEGNRG